MSILVLVRHGQSTWNLEKRFTGWVDVDLTKDGELQAEKAGYLIKKKSLNKINYSANKKHPLFSILQKIVRKHLGLEDIINNIIDNIGNVKKIIILDDYAKGIDSGHIKVVIEGKKLNTSKLDNISIKIENKIKRKITIFINKNIQNKTNLVIFEK